MFKKILTAQELQEKIDKRHKRFDIARFREAKKACRVITNTNSDFFKIDDGVSFIFKEDERVSRFDRLVPLEFETARTFVVAILRKEGFIVKVEKKDCIIRLLVSIPTES